MLMFIVLDFSFMFTNFGHLESGSSEHSSTENNKLKVKNEHVRIMNYQQKITLVILCFVWLHLGGKTKNCWTI